MSMIYTEKYLVVILVKQLSQRIPRLFIRLGCSVIVYRATNRIDIEKITEKQPGIIVELSLNASI